MVGDLMICLRPSRACQTGARGTRFRQKRLVCGTRKIVANFAIRAPGSW